jgi:hypothetical protein
MAKTRVPFATPMKIILSEGVEAARKLTNYQGIYERIKRKLPM